MSPLHTQTLILGAGLSGLALASRTASSAVVLEAASRIGGWVESTRRKDGSLFEHGPHSLRISSSPNSVALLDLLARLKPEPIHASADAKKRLIWLNGALKELPSSLSGALRDPLTRSLPWLSILKDVLGMSSLPPARDESVHEFAMRKLGPTAANVLVPAFIAGVYAGDATQLSSEMVFRDFYEQERRLGSAFRPSLRRKKTPATATLSFAQGMGEFPAALLASLKSTCDVRLNDAVVRLEREDNHKWIAHTLSGAEVIAPRVLSTLPLHSLAQILPPKFVPLLDQCARATPCASVAVINLRFPHQRLPSGFGHLVASPAEQAQTGVLGCIYDSVAFPSQQLGTDGCVLSLMMGGMHAPWVATLSKDEILARALQACTTQLGLNEEPIDYEVRVHIDCIPQYRPGHVQRAAYAQQQAREHNLWVLGTGVLGVGIVDSVGGALRVAGLNNNFC